MSDVFDHIDDTEVDNVLCEKTHENIATKQQRRQWDAKVQDIGFSHDSIAHAFVDGY